MLVVESLVKSYGDLNAVDDVSFEARAGTVFGLLGPNGAGKSTTINCISGLLTPTAGRIAVNGHDVVKDGKAARRALGIDQTGHSTIQNCTGYESIFERKSTVIGFPIVASQHVR